MTFYLSYWTQSTVTVNPVSELWEVRVCVTNSVQPWKWCRPPWLTFCLRPQDIPLTNHRLPHRLVNATRRLRHVTPRNYRQGPKRSTKKYKTGAQARTKTSKTPSCLQRWQGRWTPDVTVLHPNPDAITRWPFTRWRGTGWYSYHRSELVGVAGFHKSYWWYIESQWQGFRYW